jgi:hypothetical protein
MVPSVTHELECARSAKERVSEQRIGNPCVGGSLPPRVTKNLNSPLVGLFSFKGVAGLGAISLGYRYIEPSFKGTDQFG